jgi:hypothetical protein
MIAALPSDSAPVAALSLAPVKTKLEKDTIYMPSSVAARLLGNSNGNGNFTAEVAGGRRDPR